MSRFVFWVVLVVGIIPALSISVVRAQDTKDDDKAKEIYGQFIKAKKARDLERVMKLMEVPFLDSTHEIIRDVKELREGWKQLLEEVKDPSKVRSDIKEVLSYPQFRERFKDNPDAVKLLDEMKLTRHDRVIMESFVGFVIRIRNGKAKIVGMVE